LRLRNTGSPANKVSVSRNAGLASTFSSNATPFQATYVSLFLARVLREARAKNRGPATSSSRDRSANSITREFDNARSRITRCNAMHVRANMS